MGTKQSVGKQGEEVALIFLKSQGYKVEATNYRTTLGEIDIIARDNSALVFIEVKTRKTQTFGLPLEAVSFRKQAKIRQVALQFLADRASNYRNLRFDVISIVGSPTGKHEIEHILNAF